MVFTQSGCGPCTADVPELNGLQDRGEVRVPAVNNGEPDAARHWAAEQGVRFPKPATGDLATVLNTSPPPYRPTRGCDMSYRDDFMRGFARELPNVRAEVRGVFGNLDDTQAQTLLAMADEM